ncbi:Phloretin 4'-O-glucosyltransferase [Linum grandiflorum]
MAAVSQQKQPHVLLVTFPAQGHMNPSLHFSIQLVSMGCRVTLVTTVSGSHLISKSKNILLPPQLSVETYSDGYDVPGSSWSSKDDQTKQWDQMNTRGPEFLTHLITTKTPPFAWLVYSPLLTWAADVAQAHNLPATLLWIQPATVMDIYFHLFHGGDDGNGHVEVFDKCKDDPSFSMKLPGLSSVSFTSKDLPSFALHPNQYPLLINGMKQQVHVLTRDNVSGATTKSKPEAELECSSPVQFRPKVLVNTFDELEIEAIKANVELDMVGVGPLIPSCFWDDDDNKKKNDHDSVLTWLDSKATSSVIYVSFGTMAAISKKQREEIGKGLLSCNRPFLWVTRKDQAAEKQEEEKWREETETAAESVGGKIVEWCSQVEVLSHEAVGCFVTHCGWNSTLESMCLGVPLVGFPQFSDQTTNAKLVEDVWKTGVRVAVPEKVDGDETEAVVEGDEIRRCLDLVMGDGSQVRDEVRRNANKWKQLARDALREGGSSRSNLEAFVDQIFSK